MFALGLALLGSRNEPPPEKTSIDDGAELPNVTSTRLTVPDVARVLRGTAPLPATGEWQTGFNGVEFRLGFNRGHDSRFIRSCQRRALWLELECRNREVEDMFVEVVIMDPQDLTNVFDRRMKVRPDYQSPTTRRYPLLCALDCLCESPFVDTPRNSDQPDYRKPWKREDQWKDMVIHVNVIPLVPIWFQNPTPIEPEFQSQIQSQDEAGPSEAVPLPTATDTTDRKKSKQPRPPSSMALTERVGAWCAICRSIAKLMKHHNEYHLFFNVRFGLTQAEKRAFVAEVEEFGQDEEAFPVLLGAFIEVTAAGRSNPTLRKWVKEKYGSHPHAVVAPALQADCPPLVAYELLDVWSKTHV